MIEKTNFENSQAKKERFEFVLTVNGNIICQRYFRINNFKESSLGSVQLTDAIDDCVSIIDTDLKKKSNLYLWYTAPQVFENKEQMEKWVKNPTFDIEVPSYVVLKDSNETFTWSGSEMVPYDKPFNKSDYIKTTPDTPYVLKFAFLDEGREIRSISWDGNVYPKFVRSNIDISNSRNKYKADNVYAPMEEFLVDKFNDTFEDAIPVIVKRICTACSKNESYDKVLDYGKKKYNVDIQGQIKDYIRKAEAKYRKKTESYNNSR